MTNTNYNYKNAVTIGYEREDGTLQVLATLKNNDDLMGAELFSSLIESVCNQLYIRLGADNCIMVLEREDAPDYIDLPDDYFYSVNG